MGTSFFRLVTIRSFDRQTERPPSVCLSNAIGIFVFCSLDLDPMIFAYKFDPYSLEMYRMSENELLTSRLSKVIV